MYKNILRPGIAMIELIFAIVIMGIVLMSAPQLMQTASSGAYVAIQQEGISEAASRINMIMAYQWDEGDTNESFYAPLLTVSNGASDLDPSGERRRGTPTNSYRTFLRRDGVTFTASTSLGKELGESIENDIDDFNSATPIHLIDLSGGTANSDYIEKGSDINISTSVTYIDDDSDEGGYQVIGGELTYVPFRAPTGAGTTNIKSITVTLTSTSGTEELEKTISLHAFSSNIGTHHLEVRDF